MAFIARNIIKKLWKNDDLIQLKGELERSFNQLKENVIYSQRLVQIGSWTHDIQKDEIFLSDEVYHILGSSPQEFDGKLENYYSYVHPDDLEEVKTATQEAIEGKEYDIEYRIITSNGAERYVHEKTRALYDENSNPVKMVGIMQDITKHKLIENNLKVLGGNLSHAQRVAGVGSWKYDVIKDEFYGSEEMYRIYGMDAIDFKKDFNNAVELIHSEDQIKVLNAMENYLAGETCKIEYRIPQYDGTMKFVMGKGEPLYNKEQRVVGVLGTVQDITEKKLLEEKLKKSYKNLAEAQQLAHIGSWEMDIARNKNYWSEETYKIFGITSEQYDGSYEGFLKFVHPDDIGMMQNILKNPPGEQIFDMEFRIIRADGSVRNIYELMEFKFDKDRKPSFIHGTIQDITEKKILEKKFEASQERISNIQRRFQVLVQESSDVFEIIASNGTIQYISQSAEKILGCKPEERIGKKVFEFYEGKELQKLTKMVELVLKDSNKKVQEDIIFKTKAGKEIFLEVNMKNLLYEPSIQGIVMNFRDITGRVEMEKRMAHIATYDELTGLPNRIYFNKQLKVQYQHAKEKHAIFALMILDIDGFRYINGALGYQLGDQLIINIAQRLKAFQSDTKFICRYSGDQFAIIVQGLSTIEEYEGIAKDITRLFSQTFKVDMYELDVTISMGISIYIEDKQNTDLLIRHANIAMLRAKNEGKNRYKFYSPDINIQNYKQFEFRNDLRKAIEKDQLRLYYQPIVKLKTNEILAVEALIRWNHPNWGLVSPNEFIFLAEETGFIINIGNWLLREVCRNYKQWLNDGLLNIKVSINFSSVQFFENNFVDNIINTIDEFELDPHFLIMEITERILMEKTNKAISDIQRLQSFGIQVALDDFGTGFSSLAHLNSFNIDILKIDGSFIKNILLEETSTVITRSIINMARELKIKMVAEGIENWEQLYYLRGLNCYSGQGFLYSKPVPLKEFEKTLAKRKCKPILVDDSPVKPYKNRRKFFRIEFNQLLEADMTVLEIKGKKIKVGNTKVLIKNIGAGGLCFNSNMKLPIETDFILQFKTQLLGKELKVYGCTVWTEEIDDNLFEYGIKFTFDENDRSDIIKELNEVQIKMRNNILFADGSFVSGSAGLYFSAQTT